MTEIKEVYISPNGLKISSQEKKGYKRSKVKIFHNDCSEYVLVGVLFPFKKGLIVEKSNLWLN